MNLKVVIFLFYCLASAKSQQCHVQGKVNGVIKLAHVVTSYNECLNYCKADTACTCFTYYEDLGECVEFSEFNSLDTSCMTCISGETACPEFNNCNIDGFCGGTLIDIKIANSEADCLARCQADDNCAFYAYQGTDGSCALLEDCSNVTPCTDCHSGERTCSISSQGNLTILMVVGGVGSSSSAFNDVEFIDLSGQGRTCRKPEDFPGARQGSVGTYIQERALVCGGYFYIGGGIYTSECYYYNTNGTWTQGPSMTEAREHTASTFYNNQWWITAGYNSDQGTLASTELFNSTSNSFVPFVNLPEERESHNLVSIDDNRAILLGGQDFFVDTYICNDGTWEDGPVLSKGRQQSQAGLVTFNNGTKMIVAASGQYEKTTEFLPVDGEEWHFGPDLPYYIFWGASVQLEKTFLIVGGFGNGTSLDTIWTFDIEKENWVLLEEHLKTERQLTAAFLVPDEYC